MTTPLVGNALSIGAEHELIQLTLRNNDVFITNTDAFFGVTISRCKFLPQVFAECCSAYALLFIVL
jgi:hypothetical protein